MEVIGFQVEYPKTHHHQIECMNDAGFDGSKDILEKVITRLQELFRENRTNEGKKKAISQFLEYHYQKSLNKKNLISQLLKITEDSNWAYKFKPYSDSIGFVQDWIEENKLSIENKFQSEIKIQKQNKSFQDLIIDNNKFLSIEKRLIELKYINADLWQDGYVKLAALYRVLVKHNVIRVATSAGKLFSERYSCTMDLKPFQRSYNIKGDIIEQIEKDCGLS